MRINKMLVFAGIMVTTIIVLSVYTFSFSVMKFEDVDLSTPAEPLAGRFHATLNMTDFQNTLLTSQLQNANVELQ